MRILLRVFCSFVLALLVAVPASADQTGEIRGNILNVAGGAVPGVVVTATGPGLQGYRTAVSDAHGAFRLPLLPVGTYELAFESPGFDRLTKAGNDVRLGQTTTMPVTMKLPGVTALVNVTSESPLVDVTRADTSYSLRGEELARVPAQSRTIAEVVGFTPGVTGVRVNTVTGSETGLPSFRGEGGAGNSWLVDGLSTNGVNTNDSGVRVNYDAWQEVQVISDGFGAELGQAMGGFVNVVTKSGGNAFRGELGALIRGQNLRAARQEQLSVASLPETSIGQYFGNLGGPIVKDRLWFFVSDNYFSTVDRTTDQSVGWLAIPGGERSATTNNGFGKVTFTPRDNHTISVSGTFDTSLQQAGGIGVPATYTTTSYDNSMYRLNYTGILGPNVFVTAAVGQNRRNNGTAPQSGDYGIPSYYWEDIAQRTNNVERGVTESERRTDVSLAGSWTLDAKRWGSHEVKAGLSYYSNSYQSTTRWTGRNADPFQGDGFGDGASITWTAPGIPFSLMENQNGTTKNSTEGLGFHLQDTIIFGRFTLMLGLRTDTQRVFNDAGEKVWSWGPGDFLQPRASVAVDLFGDGRTLFKAAYGQFAVPVATQSLTFFNHNWALNFRQYSWAGPANPSDLQMKDLANWQFQFEQSNAAPPEVDPALKPDRVQRVLVGLERQLSSEWAMKLRGVYSWSRNLIEDVDLYAPDVPGELRWVVTNFDLKRRDYRALEVELNGRVAGKLFLDASYTWSSAKGTVPGNYRENGTWGGTWGGAYGIGPFGDRPYLPPGSLNKEQYDQLFAGLGGVGIGDEGWYGYLPYSVDHDVKILATYLAPYGFRISPSLEWLSGYHWEKKGWSDYGSYLTFPEGRGGRTTPAHAYVDLGVEKDFSIGRGLTVVAGINVYNLFNSQLPVSYVKEDTELFGQVWARQLPRWVQLKAAVRF
jgi:Carboxypeptidase regulatory-like domain/TonB-dependent Receptor Plug Domain